MEKQLLLRVKKLEKLVVDLYKKLSGGTGTSQLSSQELGAIQASNSPSATNPFITQNELLYDTTEVLTGALWSGQPVYRIVIPFTITIGDPAVPFSIEHGIGVETYLKMDVTASPVISPTEDCLYFFPLAACSTANGVNTAIVSEGFIRSNKTNIYFESVRNATTSTGTFYLILEYTKLL